MAHDDLPPGARRPDSRAPEVPTTVCAPSGPDKGPEPVTGRAPPASVVRSYARAPLRGTRGRSPGFHEAPPCRELALVRGTVASRILDRAPGGPSRRRPSARLAACL